MADKGRGKRNGKGYGGVKALVSISALAATLVGWGILAKDARQDTAQDPPADIGALLEGILGPMPTPVTVPNDDQSQGSGIALRPVSLPAGGSSQPAPVTRTQSSR